MGAYGLTVAAAFAVALAVLVSVSTPTAEAGDPATDASVHIGDTIEVTYTAAAGRPLEVRVASDSLVKGVFVHSGRADVSCTADVPDNPSTTDVDEEALTDCDVGDVPSSADNSVTLEFRVTAVSYTDAGEAATLTLQTDTATDGTFVDEVPSGTDPGSPVYYAHDHSISATAGSTVTVTFELPAADSPTTPGVGGHAGAGERYRISSDSTGKATFAHNGLGAIACDDVDGSTTGKCDTDKDDRQVGLRVAIADDSPKGEIFVQRYTRNATGTPSETVHDEIVITVTGPGAAVASLDVKPTKKSIPETGAGTTLNVTVTNANNDPATGIAVTLIATGVGQFNDSDCGATNNTQFCKLNTDAAGKAAVDFAGARSSGTATIVVTAGGQTKTVTITVHGGADSLATELHEGTVEAGGEANYVIVTVLDSSDRPIEGVKPTVKSSGALSADHETGLDLAGTANDLPACGGTGGGTNKDGKCAIEVTAETGTAAGEETVTVQLARTGKTALTSSSTVEVVGKPAEVVVTAPATVEPEGSTPITVTVYDANGKLAGKTEVTARKLDGSGFIDPATKYTKNGVATFEYSAGLSGAAILRFWVSDASSVRKNVTIMISEPEPEEPAMPDEPEEPAMPDAPTLTFLSPSIASFSGGSVEQLAAAAADACAGGAKFWVQASDGTWPAGYDTTVTVAIANQPFNAAWAAGIPATAVFFTECETDAMEDQGSMEDQG